MGLLRNCGVKVYFKDLSEVLREFRCLDLPTCLLRKGIYCSEYIWVETQNKVEETAWEKMQSLRQV